GFLVQLLKGTSLASIIGFTELTRAAQIVNNATFRPFIVYAIVAGLYFLLCWPLSLLSERMERRLEHAPVATVAAQIRPSDPLRSEPQLAHPLEGQHHVGDLVLRLLPQRDDRLLDAVGWDRRAPQERAEPVLSRDAEFAVAGRPEHDVVG